MKLDRGKICVAIGVESATEALSLAARESEHADVIEIRLDFLDNCEVAPFIETISVPLLFTNRPSWEGGRWQGSEKQRVEKLLAAVEAGASYIDCEMRAPQDSRGELAGAAASSKKTRLIMSWHDFDKTPSEEELHLILAEMRSIGSVIGKIVTMADSYLDVLRVLNLQKTAAAMNFPLIAFCMGKKGMISRLATVELGGYMTYCSPSSSPEGGTADGQLGGRELRELLARLI